MDFIFWTELLKTMNLFNILIHKDALKLLFLDFI